MLCAFLMTVMVLLCGCHIPTSADPSRAQALLGGREHCFMML